MISCKQEKRCQATPEEAALREQLQASANEHESLVQQQQALLTRFDRLYSNMRHMALTDAVTGLPNHLTVISRLEEAIAHCQRRQRSCAVLFMDLDHFKQVNDTWGHRAGDALLREVGARLRAMLRLEDFVGRYGGEEFVILLPEVDRQAAYQTAADVYTAIVSSPYCWQPEDGRVAVSISITISIGVAIYPLHGDSADALIEIADRAMYRAKTTERGICLADTAMPSAQARPCMYDDKEHPEVIMVVRALTAAVLAHDGETIVDSQRMAHLAEATARKLKRAEEEMYLIHLAALLHDIGKLGIPQAILHKPDSLTEEEQRIIHAHPAIGCQILEQVGGVFGRLNDSVMAHHERWDGRGYPSGLGQEAIPLHARILAVIDAYDAMTSPRPYRWEPLTASEAKTELQRCAGSQFDPRVVKVFLSVLEEQGNTNGW